REIDVSALPGEAQRAADLAFFDPLRLGVLHGGVRVAGVVRHDRPLGLVEAIVGGEAELGLERLDGLAPAFAAASARARARAGFAQWRLSAHARFAERGARCAALRGRLARRRCAGHAAVAVLTALGGNRFGVPAGAAAHQRGLPGRTSAAATREETGGPPLRVGGTALGAGGASLGRSAGSAPEELILRGNGEGTR